LRREAGSTGRTTWQAALLRATPDERIDAAAARCCHDGRFRNDRGESGVNGRAATNLVCAVATYSELGSVTGARILGVASWASFEGK